MGKRVKTTIGTVVWIQQETQRAKMKKKVLVQRKVRTRLRIKIN